MEAFIIGLCLIAVVWGIASGGGGRLMLLAAIVVGAFVGIAATLATSGVNVLGSIGELVARLGSL